MVFTPPYTCSTFTKCIDTSLRFVFSVVNFGRKKKKKNHTTFQKEEEGRDLSINAKASDHSVVKMLRAYNKRSTRWRDSFSHSSTPNILTQPFVNLSEGLVLLWLSAVLNVLFFSFLFFFDQITLPFLIGGASEE